ncbi:unnamed protein product [Agarophyton chilense]
MSHTEDFDIVGALEKLSTQVQQTADNSPSQLDHVLRHAIRTTSDLLKSSLPENVSEPWLQELSAFFTKSPCVKAPEQVQKTNSLANKEDRRGQNPSNNTVHILAPAGSNTKTASAVDEGAKQLSCVCGASLSPRSTHNEDSHPKHVTCIHGCGRVFHSAKCRKTHSRAHARDCPALQRKKLLAHIGLSSDPELF